MPNYLDIIGEFFPATEAYVQGAGDPSVYGDIQWITAQIGQGTLDAYSDQIGSTVAKNTLLLNDEQSYEPEEVITLTLAQPMKYIVVHVSNPNVTELTGASLVSAKGTGWDPGNVSTMEANINNGVLTDLCYNNSSTGTTSGLIYGIDMGEATSVSGMRRYDYSTSYYDTEWEFIGTNTNFQKAVDQDPARFAALSETWEVIFTHTQTGPYLASFMGGTQGLVTFTPKSYRYWGVRCVTSYNATYSIISELELYSGGTVQPVEKKLATGTDYEYMRIDDTHICVKNLSAETKTLKTVVIGGEV